MTYNGSFDKNDIPVLTLTPTEEEPVKAVEAEVVSEQQLQLSPEEQKVIDDFAEKIDITNTTMILQYGSAAQKKMADFSETALANVRTKDMGEVGDMLSDLILQLKGFDAQEKKGLFRRAANSIAAMKAKYDKAEVNVDRIAGMLEDHQLQLFKDIALLDQLYERNLTNYKELSMYIAAGKQKLAQVRSNELPALIEKANRTGLAEDSQVANDMANFCNRFEKKIHDLELTRAISVQMAPQIRLVQNNDSIMAEKIQTSIANTIPLWKSQMVLALGLSHSQQAVEAQRAVTDMTNELLRRNAEALKMSTIETARESERGIVDMETLQHVNRMLIETFDEVIKIQNDGHARRMQAEAELGRIEGELKQKLLEIRK